MKKYMINLVIKLKGMVRMDKKRISLKSMVCVVAFPFLLMASDINQSDINNINKISNANEINISSSDTIDEWSQSVLDKFGLAGFGENNGRFFIFAQQSVLLKPNDAQFADSLVNAYNKAMMKVQEKYLMLRFGKTTVDKIKSFYSDRSTDAKELKLPSPSKAGFISKLMLLLDKKLDVMGAKLDEELVSMGVDKDSIQSMTPTMKKDIFRDKFVKNTIRKAQGSIIGLVPIQTSVASDKKGRYTIGIVAVASAKTIQIAKDISMQKEPIIKGRGKDIMSLIPKDKEMFLGTLGTRLSYDMDGTPVIISYGLSSYAPDSDDDYINDELKSNARSMAIANADAQIAELINGQMNAKSQMKTGEEVRKYVQREVRPNSDTVEKTIKNIIKITNKTTKSSASAKLQGISTVKRWNYTSKDKHRYVGVVRVWKYSTLRAINSFNKPKEIQKKQTTHQYNSDMSSSQQINTIDDF
jgi:hypothetical protein